MLAALGHPALAFFQRIARLLLLHFVVGRWFGVPPAVVRGLQPDILLYPRQPLDEIKQRFGEGAIMKLSEAKPVNVNVISTGSVSIDMALGVGGVPRGRVIEIYGPEASGKTSLALHIIAEAQKGGGVGAFIDAEHALDPDYARRIGVKIEDLLIDLSLFAIAAE